MRREIYGGLAGGYGLLVAEPAGGGHTESGPGLEPWLMLGRRQRAQRKLAGLGFVSLTRFLSVVCFANLSFALQAVDDG